MSFAWPKRLAWIFASCLVLASVAALGWWSMRQPKLDRRIYRIGYEIQPPLHFQTKDGRATGFAVDLINEAARRRGIQLQWLLEPEGSELALKARKVDLWPMMTVRPERRGVVYISDPYREYDVCLLVRDDSTYSRPEDLRNSTISYNGSPLDLRVLHPLFPNAQLLVIESSKDSLEAVCRQRVDAAYFTEYYAVATLLAGVSCGGPGFRVIQLPELRGRLGVGATIETRPAAEAIRQEIGAMAVDGTFAGIAARWRSFSGRNLELADALIRARRNEHWLIAGISGAVALLVLTSWQAVRIRRARNRSEDATTQLRHLAASLQNVRDEERTRIARELHDELGQALTAIKMDIGWAADRVPAADKVFRDRFQSTLALVDTTIRNIRRIATDLRPSILDLGLNAAIEWLLEEFHSRTGVAYSLDLPKPEVEAHPNLSTAIFRILQETLTNVARHSRATRIDVRLKQDNRNLVLEVQDNGKGISQEPPLGRAESLGMRERALALGGEVTVKSPASGGTVVHARIPFAGQPPVQELGGTS